MAEKTEFEIWLERKNARTKKNGPARRVGKANTKSTDAESPRTSNTSTPRKPRKRKTKDTVPTSKASGLPKKRRAKKPKREAQKGFSKETRQAAYERGGGSCENPLCGRQLAGLGGEHHCLPRSQYHGNDRNNLWNCASICQECHARVTSPKSDEDKRLRRFFERVAYSRKTYSDSNLDGELRALDNALKLNTLDTIRTFQPISIKLAGIVM